MIALDTGIFVEVINSWGLYISQGKNVSRFSEISGEEVQSWKYHIVRCDPMHHN